MKVFQEARFIQIIKFPSLKLIFAFVFFQLSEERNVKDLENQLNEMSQKLDKALNDIMDVEMDKSKVNETCYTI